MKKISVLIAFFMLTVPFAFSVPIENIIQPEYLTQLRGINQGRIIETQLRNPVPRLLPRNNDLQRHVTGIRNSFNPGMMVEALYLYNKPASYRTSATSWDIRQKTGIFNTMTAISTLAGIQYYSESRNSMRTFYESSVIIDGPQSRNPQNDPVFTQLPATLTLYARQNDSTFGDNVYRYDYINTNDAIFFTQENVTAMSYGIIPVVGRGNLRSVIAVFDCGDSILVYAVSMARVASLPGMGDRISSSLSNRAEAILIWFTDRLNNRLFVE